MTALAARAGRPRRSSRGTIEDAAAELFLEQGYARTSVDQIAQRAGVSRASFFNYFSAKSDVLWVALDESAPRLSEALAAADTSRPLFEQVREAVLAVAAEFGPERAPWAVTEAEAMGIGAELAASGLPRFAAQAAGLAEFLRVRGGLSAPAANTASAAVVAAVAAAAGEWVRAGGSRGPLAPFVDAAITPLCAGLAHPDR